MLCLLKWNKDASAFFETVVAGKNKMDTKKWMMSHDINKVPDPIINGTQYVYSFINDEFIHYCLYTLGRHLPSLPMDLTILDVRLFGILPNTGRTSLIVPIGL